MSVYLIIWPMLIVIDEPQDSLVDAEYVARVWNCSVYSVRYGKAGTNIIPRFSNRPLRFVKSKVHAALKEHSTQKKTAQQRATALLHRKPRRKVT